MNESEQALSDMDHQAGIITTNEWLMMPNGCQYKHFWCDQWKIITDKQMPIEGFKSAEKWSLFACPKDKSDQAEVVIPGCRVAGWCHTGQAPTASPGRADCYSIL